MNQVFLKSLPLNDYTVCTMKYFREESWPKFEQVKFKIFPSLWETEGTVYAGKRDECKSLTQQL